MKEREKKKRKKKTTIVMDGCMLMNKCPTGEGEKNTTLQIFMSNLTVFFVLVSKIILSSCPMPSTGCVHADWGQIHNHTEQVKMKLGPSP